MTAWHSSGNKQSSSLVHSIDKKNTHITRHSSSKWWTFWNRDIKQNFNAFHNTWKSFSTNMFFLFEPQTYPIPLYLHRSSYLSRSVGFNFKTPVSFQLCASLGIRILMEEIACSHKFILWWKFYNGIMESIKLQGSKCTDRYTPYERRPCDSWMR